MPNPVARIKKLRALLNQYSHAYYVLAISMVPDAEYDQLYDELVALENANPSLITPDSITQRVGAKCAGFTTAKHSDKRMLSLENTRSAAEVIAYLGCEQVVVEPKIDGASLKLIYRQGILVQAITRGDGDEGDDVTANARTIRTIPLRLTTPISVNVVGEVYMTLSVFNSLNAQLEKQGEKLLANPRNAAAGALKLKNPEEVSARCLSFVAYGTTTDISEITTQSNLTDQLEILGFQSVYMLPTTCSTLTVADCFNITEEATLAQKIAECDQLRRVLDLATDGLVFKLNSLARQKELGEGNKYPNYACAYKFPPERRETVLEAVTVQVGRTGQLTPVAELRPLTLSGSTVKRASLCNQDEINRLGINIGDAVWVEKSAEIIPKVVQLAKKNVGGVYSMPKHCPCCGTPVKRPAGFVDFFCPNRGCPEQVLERLRHACGKDALDIDGCGEALLRELLAQKVTTLSELFTFKPTMLTPAVRKRFEFGRAAAVRQPFWRKLHALGIPGFGVETCKELARRWATILDMLDDPATLVPLIGPVNFKNFVDYLGENAAEVEALDKCIGMVSEARQDGAFTGKVFCITGGLLAGTRTEIVSRIEQAGGIVKSSVTRKVNYLIQGEVVTGHEKRAQAEKLNIPIITEDQLFEMMAQKPPAQKAT